MFQLILAVRDVKQTRQFYQHIFDWPLTLDLPVIIQFDLPGGPPIMFYQRESFGINTNEMPELPPVGKIAGVELYLHVTDLEGTIERLQAAGSRLLSSLAPRSWGDEAAYFADPDGYVIAVARPITEM